MSFTFNTGIPAANNNPSADQPLMLQNNISTNAILSVDHVTFNSTLGGTHKQVTFTSKNTPAGLPTDPTSIVYTANGVSSTVSQLLFANQNANFPLSSIRAFGTFTAAVGAIVPPVMYNVVSITGAVVGPNTNFTIPLTAGATNTNNPVVLIWVNRASPNTVYFFSANQLVISSGNPIAGTIINFAILEF
jgi:hypothetical protein